MEERDSKDRPSANVAGLPIASLLMGARGSELSAPCSMLREDGGTDTDTVASRDKDGDDGPSGKDQILGVEY